MSFEVGSIEFEAFAAQHEEDVHEAVDTALRDRIKRYRDSGDLTVAGQCNRALRRPRIFKRVCLWVERKAVPEFLAAKARGEVGADGSFLKWLIEWLSHEENWQGLLKFILAIIAMFG
jgi:hypothetical protein